MNQARYRNIPEFVNIEITTACDLRCPQCYNSSVPKEMDRNTLMNYLNEIAAMGIKAIGLTGGEPLLCSYLDDIIERISQLGMGAIMVTSGSGLSNIRLEQLIGVGLKQIILSLNGSTREVHERSRNGYQVALSALELLSESSVPFSINWVPRKDNVDDFPELIKLANRYGAGKISVLRLKPASKSEKDQVLDKAELLRLAEYIKSNRNLKTEISVSECYSILRNLVYDKQENAAKTGCRAGRKYMVIDVDGYFRPCRIMKYKEKQDSIYDYWHNAKILEKLRSVEDYIEEPCGNCARLEQCRTCRVICNENYGGFYSGEKDCPLFIPSLVSNDK